MGFLVVKVECVDCGREYDLEDGDELSDFQCECGGILKNKKPITKETKNSKKSKKIVLIPILALIIVIIAFFAIYNSGYIHVSAENHTNNSSNTNQSIAYKTYAANGVTFNYPADWQPISNLDCPSRWGYGDPVAAYYDPSRGDEANMNTYFYLKENPRSYSSLDEMLSYYRSDIAELGQTEVSERNITINGMKAVELIKTWPNDGMQYQALTVHIEAVPGSVYYRFGCVVPASLYNETLPEFELVVNSFKYTG